MSIARTPLVQNDDILRTFFYKGLFKLEHCEHALMTEGTPAEQHPYYHQQLQCLPGFQHYKPARIEVLASAEHQWIRESFLSMLKVFNDRHYQFDASRLSEVQRMTLHAGEEIPWHYNLGTGPMALRKACLTVMLSPEHTYEGGQFCSVVGSTAQPQGTAIVYPSMATVCIRPVTRGSLTFLFATLDGERPFR